MNTSKNQLLNIPLPNESKGHILEEIIKYINNPQGHFHIISLNPETCTLAEENHKFKKVVKWARVRIIDGAGVIAVVRLLRKQVQERIAGVDFMKSLLDIAHNESLTVMLIGGGPKIAERVADCQSKKYLEAKFFAHQGIKNIKQPKIEEEQKIFSIVADVKPHFIFVAFGSPDQELWLYENRHKFEGSVCMGVGGAFDFLSGAVPRAPLFLRRIGMEWLFRLIIQPWRAKRQLRLMKFLFLVAKSEFKKRR